MRVPKGILGEETARLLGSFVVAKVWQAATHRARLGQVARVDAALYVDECQNFLNLPRSFDEMLAEARGYGLSMVLAHQHLAQLPRDLREAVSANARTKVFFSMSPEDAHALSRHVAPELTEHDLSHLGAFQAAARLVVGGEETPAFTLRTRPGAGPGGRPEAVRACGAHRPREAGGAGRGKRWPSSRHPRRWTARVRHQVRADQRDQQPVRGGSTPRLRDRLMGRLGDRLRDRAITRSPGCPQRSRSGRHRGIVEEGRLKGRKREVVRR